MTDTNPLVSLSDSLEQAVAQTAPLVASIDWGGRGQVSAILWRQGVLVTSEQSLPRAESYSAVLPGGGRLAATLAGRDPTTNVTVLRAETGGPSWTVAEPRGVGALVVAVGGDGIGGATARLGSIEVLGPAWDSQRGGRIDRLIRIGVRLGRGAEGGPVVDARGLVLGMSTFGPRGTVLTIPSATIGRVVEQLLTQGRIGRGWLGVGLHPVALPPALRQDGIEGESGLMVVNIADGAPAAAALLPGDILLEIGGARVMTPRAVAARLGPETVGQTLVLKVLRGGSVASPSVTITARPE